MKTRFFYFYFVLLFAFVSCYDDSELKNKLNEIQNELNIQKQIITALQQGLNIKSVEKTNDGYKLVFSDGSFIILSSGHTPFISVGENGNWFIDNIDTGKTARGENGTTPTITIGVNGNWFINGIDTGQSAQGKIGTAPIITIGTNGNWFINGEDTGKTSLGANGTTPNIVIGENGNWIINSVDTGIKATARDGMDASYITSILQIGSDLIFYFSNGTKVSVPIDENFVNKEIRIYGVRINRNTPAENEIERIYNSVGLNALTQVEGITLTGKDDFANVYPFNEMKICNVERNWTGALKIIYENEAGFSRQKDTFVEIPLFYMKRYFKDNYDYRLISQTPYGGYYPAPMFIEDGKVLNKIYIGVYETSVDEQGAARSVTGQIPVTSKTISEFRKLYANKGSGFSSLDIRTIMSLQHLYLIYFANKNSQNVIGGGWTDLAQPIIKILNNSKSISKSIIIEASASHLDYHWFIGQSVCTVKGYEAQEYANIVEILKNNPIVGQTTIVLDRAVNIDETLTFGASAQFTGWSDILANPTGRTKQNNINLNNQVSAVKLFGIENLWGNVWEFVDGLMLKGLTPYVGFETKTYNDNGEGYIPMAFQCIEQKENDPYHGTFGFITNLGIDNVYTWFALPESVGENNVNKDSGYGDFFYQLNDLTQNRYAVFGGGFDHFYRAGLFNLRNWNPSNKSWYLYGSRMQFKLSN